MNSENRDPEERNTSKPRKHPFAMQWSLQTLFLLTAVVAVWAGYLSYRRQLPRLEAEIAAMRRMAAELTVEDPGQIAVVKLPETWYDQQRWEIHLPFGAYEMHLATRQVGMEGLAPVLGEAPVSPGRHQVELQQVKVEDGWNLSVLIDGATLIEASEEPQWQSNGSSEGGGQYADSTQLPPNEPVVLFRRRFQRADKNGQYATPKQPSEGLLLWIERVDR